MGKSSFELGPSMAGQGSEYKSYDTKETAKEPKTRDPYVLRAIERVKTKFKTTCTEINRSGRGS